MIINEFRLKALVDAVEGCAEKIPEGKFRAKNTNSVLDSDFAEPIVRYLLSPYENGYWELKADWCVNSKFADFFLNELSDFFGLSEIIEEANSVGFDELDDIAKKMSEKQLEDFLKATTRLSPIFSIFRFYSLIKSNRTPKKLNEQQRWLESIDFEVLFSEFPEACNIFDSEIYFNRFQPNVIFHRPIQTKSALLTFLEVPRIKRQLLVVCMNKKELNDLASFYKALGVIDDFSISRVFAPDEALFYPYFPLVSSVLNHTIDDKKMSHVFARALAYYEEQDFQHCISSLGLIAEDYLQRVYTTLLRESLPGGLTLGNILHQLNSKIDGIFKTNKSGPKDIEPLYTKIKNLPSPVLAATLQPLLRELVDVIKDDRKRFGELIDKISNPKPIKSIFPSKVNENINELLRWRNAASHNSRIALGAHEADRSLYCLISLIAWWQEQIASLDWDEEKVDIIQNILVAAKA